LAEHGCLHQFYNKKILDTTLKLSIALDIIRGLNFLEAYEILHHDIRSDNIMIDHHEHAKIANFGMSRGFTDATRSLEPTMENVRYMAPEKIKNSKYPYDSRCEVFR